MVESVTDRFQFPDGRGHDPPGFFELSLSGGFGVKGVDQFFDDETGQAIPVWVGRGVFGSGVEVDLYSGVRVGFIGDGYDVLDGQGFCREFRGGLPPISFLGLGLELLDPVPEVSGHLY